MRIIRIVSAILLFAMASLSCAGAVQAAQRLALVIGNSAYTTGALPNPTNDAVLIADALTETGFKVALMRDLSNVEMYRAVVQFGRDLQQAGPDTIGFFFYAGHAIQADGENYLIPVDASIRDEIDLHPQTLNASVLMSNLRNAGNRINIVVLDACRDSPFDLAQGKVASGLAKISPPDGTLVAYSTEPGKTASDGQGENSPYSHALARAMRIPGIAIEQTFKRVRNDVMERSSNLQIPKESTSLTEDFYFKPPEQTETVASNEKNISDEDSPQSQAMEYWLAVRGSADPVLLQSVVDRYPGTVYAQLATVKLHSIEMQVAALTPETDDAQSTTTRSAPANETADQMWHRLQSSTNRHDFETYLNRFPNGRHSKRVEARIASLSD